MIEVFKAINGYEGIYSISNFGRVYSHSRTDYRGNSRVGKYLKCTSKSTRYPTVVLRRDNKNTARSVHTIVAEAFLPNHFEGAVVNHIDENKTNNRADNLEYVTQKQNCSHSSDYRRVCIVAARAKYYLVTFPCNKQEVIYNLSKFCREHDLNVTCMSDVVQGRQKKHKGFKCGRHDDE